MTSADNPENTTLTSSLASRTSYQRCPSLLGTTNYEPEPRSLQALARSFVVSSVCHRVPGQAALCRQRATRLSAVPAGDLARSARPAGTASLVVARGALEQNSRHLRRAQRVGVRRARSAQRGDDPPDHQRGLSGWPCPICSDASRHGAGTPAVDGESGRGSRLDDTRPPTCPPP
jgi:hypothetical protein